MKISSKLFWALLGLTSVVLIATLSLARWSFDRGFLDFINELENERLHKVSSHLIEDYVNAGNSWHNIQLNGLNFYLDQNSPTIPVRRPPHLSNTHQPSPYPRDAARPNRAPRKPDIGPPTALFDHQGKWLTGEIPADNLRSEISIPIESNGELIGELRSWPRSNLNSPTASAFSQDQLWTSLLIGVICLILAALMSWLLARLLSKPLKQIHGGVSQLSKGDYTVSFVHERQDEIGQLMNDIQHLSLTLSQNRSAKNRWLADISHELRTPLTILSGEIDALQAGLRPFNQQQLQSLAQETARLRHLVDDLFELSLSDIGGLRYLFSRLNLNDCLAEVLNTLGQTIEAKGLVLEVESNEGLWLIADQRRIEQLLINLLNNAINYTDPPGKITIHLSRDGNDIIMLIDDTAPSATEIECQFLFDVLYRQDAARTRRSSGAGLGLSICKNIVEAHKGSISAQPSSLGGLQIRIQLPCSRETL